MRGGLKRLAFGVAAICAAVCGLVRAADSDMAWARGEVNPSALRRMIADARDSFAGQFPRADEFLSRLAEHEKRLAEVDAAMARRPGAAEVADIRRTIEDARAFQREVALSHPLLCRQPILFVSRPQYAPDHHNTETIFHTSEPNRHAYRPGGPLKLLHPQSGRVTVLHDPGPEGLIRDPDVYFDGRRVLFAWRRSAAENYSIYEIEVDPSDGFAAVKGGPRRLTGDPDATDIDPAYLPDGRIVFSSVRQPKYCHCNMHIMANLCRMDGDGANIHQISRNTLFDGHSSLLPDGRVLYDRWEYVDRNFADAQGLWTANPDGTNHALYWGNNVPSPDAILDARAIPGVDKVICIFAACHDRPWGAMAIVDRGRGIDVPEAVERLWPESARKRLVFENRWAVDSFLSLETRYEDPYPLADGPTGVGGTCFLVSRLCDPLPSGIGSVPWHDRIKALNTARMGIYFVDTFGNEILLHAEEAMGCFDPMVLSQRARPPVIPDRRDFVSPTGTMYVTDVYTGTHMRDVRRGDVAALRVVESREKRFYTGPLWTTAMFPAEGKRPSGGTLNRPAISWAGFEVKQVIGAVPVEKDGSAYFELPAERFVYFQLLDRDGMAIATMRSGTFVQPGEKQGCIGCHENRLSTQPPASPPMALRRPASKLSTGPVADRPFNYLAEIQPIWDKHCVTCHDIGGKGEKLLLAGDKELIFNASYVSLFKNWHKDQALVKTVGLGLAPIIAPRSVGSHASRLTKVLRDGHNGVRLSDEEMCKVVTWLDIGGPYYPDYASAYPQGLGGRSPISQAQIQRLEKLTGTLLTDKGNATHATHTFQVSFDRPEMSPCLRQMDKAGDAYREALAIIKAGQESLRQRPRADMPGFVPSAEHQVREAKYQEMAKRERTRRQAIHEGRQVYDPLVPPNAPTPARPDSTK